jgi:AcrR family transcriptional regulator
MVIRQRAIQAEDKQERYHALLDAAERLLARAPDRIANVGEVADEAGLAKGTVYLYFPSKDELLLALHERHVDDFFDALIATLRAPQPVTIERLIEITQHWIVERATFLPLATRCFGIMSTQVSRDVAASFHERMAERFGAAGTLLDRRFARFKPGDGVALLRHSYALVVGLWQMSSANVPDAHAGLDAHATGAWDYATDLARALRHLWEGTIGGPLPSGVASPLETVP